ncbi:MAG: heavy metal translocating P-type ATPase, partial [Sinomicrobium sp.]|nr:heavy metal translocating P-type ATPase [Sinomicrobium sp.]
HVYFEAATVILTLVLLGQLLEARAHSKTGDAIKALMKLAPDTAVRVAGGKEETIAVDAIKAGDMLKIKPGEKIPVDGRITEGHSVIDESAITGEPVPADKKEGDTVSSGTLNGNGAFLMQAENVGSDTLLSRIIAMVNAASRSRAPMQKLADKISGYFVPAVLGVAVLTFAVWKFFGPEPSFAYAFVNAVAVLIIACPCALGLATPMSVMVGVGKGALSGILIKNAEALEKMNTINTLIVDKTGTLTEGKPSVENAVSFSDRFTENDLLRYIMSLNSSSEHPLAGATVSYAKSKGITAEKVEHFESVPGKGVTGYVNHKQLALGNPALMDQMK